MKLLAVLVMLLGAVGYTHADCYPGDTIFTSIVQEIYHGVTSDNIVLNSANSITRRSLCATLTRHHNYMRNWRYQRQTNSQFLGYLSISTSDCVNALTYTRGYNYLSDWQRWAGYHSGYWYGTTRRFSDSARWQTPRYIRGDGKHQYILQSVRFDSQDRVRHCRTRDRTGATCRYGWNHSGRGVLYIWGWDPKDNGCTRGGRRGTHVGFPFNVGGASCIVWVTTEEAFLECVRNGHRTSTNNRSGSSLGFGQWTLL